MKKALTTILAVLLLAALLASTALADAARANLQWIQKRANWLNGIWG